MNEQDMKQFFGELLRTAVESKASEVKAELEATLGSADAASLISGWVEENPGYFEVLATDPPALAKQLKRFSESRRTAAELERLRVEAGEEVIRKVKDTLKRVERLRPPVETGSRARTGSEGGNRLLRNIINSITN